MNRFNLPGRRPKSRPTPDVAVTNENQTPLTSADPLDPDEPGGSPLLNVGGGDNFCQRLLKL